MSHQAKNWCIKQYNVEKPLNFVENVMSYLIYQKEEAPKTKKQYLQGYVQFAKQLRLKQVQTFFPGAHFEVARGTVEQNVSYCSKKESQLEPPIIFGKLKVQGKRTDLKELKKSFDSSKKKSQKTCRNLKKKRERNDLVTLKKLFDQEDYDTFKYAASDYFATFITSPHIIDDYSLCEIGKSINEIPNNDHKQKINNNI